jgi:hypothetical protein
MFGSSRLCVALLVRVSVAVLSFAAGGAYWQALAFSVETCGALAGVSTTGVDVVR